MSKTENDAEFGRVMEGQKTQPQVMLNIKERNGDETKSIKKEQGRHSTKKPSVEHSHQTLSSIQTKGSNETERRGHWSKRDRSKEENMLEASTQMERQDGERSPGSHRDQHAHHEHKAAKNDSSKRKNNTSRLSSKSSSRSRKKPSKDKGKRVEDSAPSKKRKFDGDDKRNERMCTEREVKDIKKNKTATRLEKQAKKESRAKPMKQELYNRSESSSGSDSDEGEEEEEEDDDDQ